jgi:hypothetical protein
VKTHRVVRRRGFHIFSLDKRLTDGGKIVSLTRLPPFTPPGRFLVPISFRGWVYSKAIVRLERLGQLIKSTSWGLEPATFHLVALTNYAIAWPLCYWTRIFVIVCTRACHWTLLWVIWIYSTHTHVIFLELILILSSNLLSDLPRGFFPLRSTTKHNF